MGRQLPDPRLLSYDSYDLPDAESEREIVRILFFFHFDLIGRTVYHIWTKMSHNAFLFCHTFKIIKSHVIGGEGSCVQRGMHPKFD